MKLYRHVNLNVTSLLDDLEPITSTGWQIPITGSYKNDNHGYFQGKEREALVCTNYLIVREKSSGKVKVYGEDDIMSCSYGKELFFSGSLGRGQYKNWRVNHDLSMELLERFKLPHEKCRDHFTDFYNSLLATTKYAIEKLQSLRDKCDETKKGIDDQGDSLANQIQILKQLSA